MFKNMEQLFKRWHARTLTVSVVVASAFLVGAPSLARLSQTTPAAPCTTPTIHQQVVIIPSPQLHINQVNPITVDPTTDEIQWSCPVCDKQNKHWAVIFNQTQPPLFGDYIFDHEFQKSGCPVVSATTDDQNFGYIVYVGNQYLDPQVIIKGTGIQGGRRKKGKDTH
jgi:hypothetical protein